MMEELEKSINRLDYWEKLADLAQEEWEDDPTDESKEKAATYFYELQWEEWLHAVSILIKLGAEEKTARQMLNRGNREKLIDTAK